VFTPRIQAAETRILNALFIFDDFDLVDVFNKDIKNMCLNKEKRETGHIGFILK
jgi:hypothetical protein